MHSGSGRLAVKQKSAVSVYVGIATLLLEGRVLGSEDDEENFLGVSQAQHNEGIVDEIEQDLPSTARHGGINRISEKLMKLRQYPGTSKDIVETVVVPVHSRDECEYERQPSRLHHVASAREFQRNPRLTSFSSSSTSNLSCAASVLHDIEVDWNDISILLSGLDEIANVPTFPLKLSTSHNYKTSSSLMPINHESPIKLYKAKIQHDKIGSLTTTRGSTKPKFGPHCEKFLKKIGLVKMEASETDIVHMCAHSNNYCRRWQFHLKKLLQIVSKNENACIEVYLGPENNAILLEQWVLTLTDKPSTSTMTIQSLCSAIRSQLYFSQISSWIELLRKAFDGDYTIDEKIPNLFTPEIMQNPRLKKNLHTMQVDLDILFRIKPYDGSSSFTDKPNIHNFPDTIVSDGIAICICLKTLPRLEKIPTLNTEKAYLNGFSCDNRIKTSLNVGVESPVAGSSRHVVNDRMTYVSCHEKGKHRCKNEDEYYEILNDGAKRIDEKKEVSDLDTVNSPLTNDSSLNDFSTSNSSVSSTHGLSHRERQLLKYKKRLMKREKQHMKKKQQGNEEQASTYDEKDLSFSNTADINNMEIPLYNNNDGNSHLIKKDANDKNVVFDETSVKTAIVNTDISKNNENSKHALTTTLSIATQTEFNDTALRPSTSSLSLPVTSLEMSKCDSCGNQLQCLDCDKIKLINNNSNTNKINNSDNLIKQNNNQRASALSRKVNLTSNNYTTSSAMGTMIGKKSDLLLQAIQRTAIAHENEPSDNKNGYNGGESSDTKNHKNFSSSKLHITRDLARFEKVNHSIDDAVLSIGTSDCDKPLQNMDNNLNTNNNKGESTLATVIVPKEATDHKTQSETDCRLCKRQKTKHIPSMNTIGSNNNINNNSNNINHCSSSNYRRTMSECLVSMSPEDETGYINSGIILSSMHNSNDLNVLNHSQNTMLQDDYTKVFSYGELKAFRRAFSDDVINQLPMESNGFEIASATNDEDEDDCISFKCDHNQNQCNGASQLMKHKLTPNVTLQLHQNNDDYCRNNFIDKYSSNDLSNQRIPKINLNQIFDKIQNDSGFGVDSSELIEYSPTNDNVFLFNSPVKSYPPTIQLSPRPNSMNKRSRHFSDRSSLSISEYNSDEEETINFTEDQKSTINSNKCEISTSKISSLYKTFVKKTQTAFNRFSKLPMLGNIEENLLHNRFHPKAVVEGFKLLLCASGSFCPTQLTIPAQTYFFEFQGVKHMSTPYVCEFRLSRRYSIPRFGTVQATLLNPQGTVVRMFFVPYDFRDMPSMSQTFIRQRIIAVDENTTNQRNVEQMNTNEQMKHLRYVINLRFQTSRSGRLCLHTDIKLIISRHTEFDTAAAHAKNSLESANDLKTITITPDHPKISSRIDKS